MGDFPAMLANGPMKNSKDFLKGYAYQLGEYEQAGTDIPARKIQDEQLNAFGYPTQGTFSISNNPTFETLLAGGQSFDINKGPGPLGRRTGEQLLRLQEGMPGMSNEQLDLELKRRNIKPTGVQLPPI